MAKSEQKAAQAVNALRAVGIESARQGDGDLCMVTLTPEDAMKMLLLTQEDGLKLIETEQRIRLGVKREVADIRGRLARLEKLAGHSSALCKKGEHILESHATGGRDGHVSTNCLACDYHADGYD